MRLVLATFPGTQIEQVTLMREASTCVCGVKTRRDFCCSACAEDYAAFSDAVERDNWKDRR